MIDLWKALEDEETYQKLLTGWTDSLGGETRQILFKLKLEDFHLKVKTFQVDSKSVCRSS
jgi:hypothetical protein